MYDLPAQSGLPLFYGLFTKTVYQSRRSLPLNLNGAFIRHGAVRVFYRFHSFRFVDHEFDVVFLKFF